MKKIFFEEEQRFNRWWLILIYFLAILSVVVPFVYGMYLQEVRQKPFREDLMSTEGLWATGILSLVIIALVIFIFLRLRLRTRIDTDGINISFSPFQRKWKKINREDIENYEIRTFNMFKDFGGYGYRRNRNKRVTYLVSGKIGLRIFLESGKYLIVGTQKKQAIQRAMEKMMNGERLG